MSVTPPRPIAPPVVDAPAVIAVEAEPPKPTPVFSPIMALLRSRKVMIGVAALIVQLLIVQVPSLEPYQGAITLLIGAITSAIILGIAHEDASAGTIVQEIVEEQKRPSEDISRELFREVFEVGLQAIKNGSNKPADGSTGQTINNYVTPISPAPVAPPVGQETTSPPPPSTPPHQGGDPITFSDRQP